MKLNFNNILNGGFLFRTSSKISTQEAMPPYTERKNNVTATK